MGSREVIDIVVNSMAEKKEPNFRDTCDQILAQLQKAHELANHMAGNREEVDDGSKRQEPDGSVGILGQQINDILKSVVTLTEKLNHIERVI